MALAGPQSLIGIPVSSSCTQTPETQTQPSQPPMGSTASPGIMNTVKNAANIQAIPTIATATATATALTALTTSTTNNTNTNGSLPQSPASSVPQTARSHSYQSQTSAQQPNQDGQPPPPPPPPQPAQPQAAQTSLAQAAPTLQSQLEQPQPQQAAKGPAQSAHVPVSHHQLPASSAPFLASSAPATAPLPAPSSSSSAQLSAYTCYTPVSARLPANTPESALRSVAAHQQVHAPASSPLQYTPRRRGRPPRQPRLPLQNQPQPLLINRPSPGLQGHPSKPPIMDPPSASYNTNKSRSQPASPPGFPSPGTNHARLSVKFNEDIQRMNFAVGQSVPEAVRLVIRDNWEKCLLGSEFHQAFILNASIHHTSGQIIRRSIKDFGSRMVEEARDELVGLFVTKDFDDLAGTILDQVSSSFLDKALEKRLRTIEARPLIDALANAGRLGYDPNDVIQNNNERVIPSQPAHPPDGATSDGRWNCGICGRYFQADSAYRHHVKKQVCLKEPPSANGFSHSCPYCGQGFTTIVGLQYHNTNRVCGDFGQPAKPISGATHSNPINLVASNLPPTRPHVRSHHRKKDTPPKPQVAQFMPTPSKLGGGLPASSSHTPSPSAAPLFNGKYMTSYEHLTPDNRDALIEELRLAEVKYAERIRHAETIVDPEQRLGRLEAYKNSFSTKQSMVRKRFGIRLRERRSRAQMEEERERLGLQSASTMSNAAIQKAMAEIQEINGTKSPSPGVSRRGSGWTPANTSSGRQDDGHVDKRQRTASGPAPTAYAPPYGDSPRRKALAVTEMGGGLGGSPATAAIQDPTTMMNNGQNSPSQGRTMASVRAAGVRMSGGHRPCSSEKETLSSGVKSELLDTDGDEDGESSDDDDIPAVVPSNGQKMLSRALHM